MNSVDHIRRSRAATVPIIALLGALVVTNAHAGEDCSEATLQGPYGFNAIGSSPAGEHFAVVGLTTFDGLGRWHSDNTSSVDAVSSRSSSEGIYTVSKDCTGYMLNDSEPLIQDIVIIDGGNEMRSLARMKDAPPNAHWTGLYKKQNVKDCSAATLEGAWGYSFQGSILINESFQPYTLAGRFTSDGSGTIVTAERRVTGDEYTTPSFSVPYTVSSDCTGETGALYFVLVGDGSEVFATNSRNGRTDTGFFKKQ
jgi:hypothetical protein